MSLFKPTFWQIPLVSLDVQERLAEKTATLKQRLHQIADKIGTASCRERV